MFLDEYGRKPKTPSHPPGAVRKPSGRLLSLLAVLLLLPGAAAAVPATPTARLRAVRQQIEVRVHNQVAITRVTREYYNPHPFAVTVRDHWVLSADEVVDGFSSGTGEDRRIGVLHPRSGPMQVPRLAVDSPAPRGSAALAGDRVLLEVGPVPPRERRTIVLSTIRAVLERNGAVEVSLPRENLRRAAGESRLQMDVSDVRPIRRLLVRGVQARIRRLGPQHRRVSYVRRGWYDGGDLRVRYRLRQSPGSLLFFGTKTPTEDGTFELLVSAPAPSEAPRPPGRVPGRDLVLLVDVSATMAGRTFGALRRNLVRAVRGLQPRDRFDVVTFSDRAVPFFGGLRRATAAARQEAARLIWRLESGGRARVRGAWEQALVELAASAKGRARGIILVGSGRVQDARAALRLARRRSREIGIDLVGYGPSPNRPWLAELARAGAGRWTVADSPESLQRELARRIRRGPKPALQVRSVDFRGLDARMTLPRLPVTLPAGGQVMLLGRYSHPGRGRLRVVATISGEKRVWRGTVRFPEAGPRFEALGKLWLARRIASPFRASAPVRARSRRAVMRLAMNAGILTEDLRFVTAERVATPGSASLRRTRSSLRELRSIQEHLPGGDPVISVRAPASALQVVAHFPGGIARALRYDPMRRRWLARANLPTTVPAGLLTGALEILDGQGREHWQGLRYRNDPQAPPFEVDLPAEAAPGSTIQVRVDPLEPVGGVFVQVGGRATALRLDPETGVHGGKVTLPSSVTDGEIGVSVMVHRKGHQRLVREITVRSPGGGRQALGHRARETHDPMQREGGKR